MADPFTIFSAAGNALQFADLGIKIIRKTIEYSNSGGSQEHQALQDVVQRLTATASYVYSSFMASDQAEDLRPGPLRALRMANAECMRISQDCFDLLERLRLNRYSSIWRSLRLTLLTLSKKKEIGDLAGRIQDARSNLLLSFMVYLDHRQKTYQQDLMSNQGEVMREFTAITQTSKTFAARLSELTAKIDQLHLDEQDMKKQFEALLENHSTPVTNMAVRFDLLLQKHSPEIANTSAAVQSVILPMSVETQARRRILNSLRFAKMYERRNHITRAHAGTYEWIFERGRTIDSDGRVWNSYTDWLLDDHKSQLYWIHGKPGCGKTTMMRELDERVTESCQVGLDAAVKAGQIRQALSQWGGDGDILRGSGYFWYAGTAEQKSLSGLLQTLVFQLLEQRPDLIDKVVSASRWESAMSSDYSTEQHWDEPETTAALLDIVKLTAKSDKILFFIDGLDEHDGPDAYRYKLLDLINDLIQHTHVRACIASRPWNIFRDAFEGCPQIQLEDFTKGDISKFVHEKLTANIRFQRQQRQNPGLLEKISHIITSRASGVFLWVMLVVRDILKIVQDGGDADDIFQELDVIPPDLDDYFRRILEGVDLRYRAEAAIILQSTLCNMDYLREDTQELTSGPDMRLLHLRYLNKAMDPGFALNTAPPRAQSAHAEYVQQAIEDLHRRLNSRSMGLLEVRRSHEEPAMFPVYELWRMKIEFLHRTVRDFLHKTSTGDILRDYLDKDFDAHLFRCNLLIIDVASAYTKEYSSGLHSYFSCFFRHIQSRTDRQISTSLFEKMFALNQNGAWNHGRSRAKQSRAMLMFPLLYQSLNDRYETPLSLAVKLGWKTYIDEKLDCQSILQKEGRPVLDCALRPDLITIKPPEAWIVKRILELGGHSNQRLISGGRDFPLWAHFLHYMAWIEVPNHDELLDITCSLLEHGVHDSDFVVDPESLAMRPDATPAVPFAHRNVDTRDDRKRIASPIAFLALLGAKLPRSGMLSALTGTDMIRLAQLYNENRKAYYAWASRVSSSEAIAQV